MTTNNVQYEGMKKALELYEALRYSSLNDSKSS